MPFCPDCGHQLSSGASKFCPDCGASLSNAAQITQLKQPTVVEQPQGQQHQTLRLLGIYKELEHGERILYQGTTQTEVIFVKEAQIKKMIGQERKEVPIAISAAFVYLTNLRLVFLKLFEVSATELGEEKNLLSGVSGTFYEVPISAVTSVDMRPVKLNHKDVERFLNFFGGDESKLKKPALELIYDEKAATGRAKDYIESMLQRGLLSKVWGKVQMTYDKIFVLGEQSVALQPTLSEHVRRKLAGK